MIKKLDLYIIKKFLGTFFFVMLIILTITVVFDTSEKLEDFLRNKIPVGEIIADYYVNFVLFYGNMFSSFILFLSIIWFTSKLASHSEIVAILSGGVSFNRLLRPYFLATTLVVALSLFLNHFIVPSANEKRLKFENKYTNYASIYTNRHLELESGVLVYYRWYNLREVMIERLWIEKWKEDSSGANIKYYDLQANRAYGDSLSNEWHLEQVFIREINPNGEVLQEYRQLDTTLSFTPEDFGQRDNHTSTMTTPELIKFRDQQLKRGADNIATIDIIRYERTAYPFASYVLTLIGMAVSCEKKRGGMGINLAIGIAAAISYFFLIKVTTVAATNAGLSPMLAVWAPNLLFSAIAIFIYFRTPK